MNEENKDLFDLGSEPAGNDIDPFAMDEDELDIGGVTEDLSQETREATDSTDAASASAPFGTDSPSEASETESSFGTEPSSSTEPSKTEAPAKAAEVKESKDAKVGQAKPGQAAAKQAAAEQTTTVEQSFDEKPPVFEYAGATENIDDTSKTFDELRIEKASDFPELEDGKRVSWTVEYGKITKTVPDPKGTSIGKMKTDIEGSKEFEDSLKKRGADKNPVCKVKPRVTAQSKGQATNGIVDRGAVSNGAAASYRGVFINMEEAEEADKVISIIPAKDGNVYEIRRNVMGKFITPVKGCDLLSDVRAGFIPAPGIPLIPMNIMMRVVAFFRHYVGINTQRASSQRTSPHGSREVLVNIYWDKQDKVFVVDVPEQTVTKDSVESLENLDFAHERYVHYMDIHSHNSMKAFFSHKDDADEKATRLYTVIGRLDKYFPDIKTRISNGGKFHEIDPSEVFELISCPFPDDWKKNVHFRVDYEKRGDVKWVVKGGDDPKFEENNHLFGTDGGVDYNADSKQDSDGYLYGYDDNDMPEVDGGLFGADGFLDGPDGKLNEVDAL